MRIDSGTVRAAAAADAQAMADIYNHHVVNTIVTFEDEPVDSAEMNRRMRDVESASFPWLAAERDGVVKAYAYAAPWHRRRSYRLTAEVTVYVAREVRRHGLGSRLYAQLMESLRRRGIHSVLGIIALPNEASVALHEKLGFKKVAHLEAVGYKLNRWIDVGYWQRML